MPTNQEWLHKLANESPDELKAWFDAEHVCDMDNAEYVHMCPNEANDENQRESGVSDEAAHSNDGNAHLKAHSKTEPMLSEQSALLSEELDSREKLEADVRQILHSAYMLAWMHGHENRRGSSFEKLYVEFYNLLDRQAAITKRETLHENPKCSGRSTCAASSTCTANRPISESADRETHDTAGIGASKDEIRDFDVWSVAYEIYCAGGYVDNGNEPNPPTDGIRELLDRQAVITANENKELIEWQAATVARLQKEVDTIKAANDDYREEVDRLQRRNDELRTSYDKLKSERDNLADDLLTCNREREHLRKHLGIALDHAHDICSLVDIDGNVLDVGE